MDVQQVKLLERVRDVQSGDFTGDGEYVLMRDMVENMTPLLLERALTISYQNGVLFGADRIGVKVDRARADATSRIVNLLHYARGQVAEGNNHG